LGYQASQRLPIHLNTTEPQTWHGHSHGDTHLIPAEIAASASRVPAWMATTEDTPIRPHRIHLDSVGFALD
jgi:hypothetical protein